MYFIEYEQEEWVQQASVSALKRGTLPITGYTWPLELKVNSTDLTHQSVSPGGEYNCIYVKSSLKPSLALEEAVWNLINCIKWYYLSQHQLGLKTISWKMENICEIRKKWGTRPLKPTPNTAKSEYNH